MAPSGLHSSGGSSRPSPARRRLRVLVADDERDTVLMLTAILRDEGYETEGVYNGRDALAATSGFDPDVVVVDIVMPGMSGWEVARAVREETSAERPLLIAISGQYTKASDRFLAESVGFNHFLQKPCDPGELLALLKPLTTRGS